MSNSDNSVDSHLPSASECDKRCKEFVSITQTDTAIAMFFLRNRKWNVEQSVLDYYESMDCSEMDFVHQDESTKYSARLKDVEGAASSGTLVDPEPHRIRLLSWNIDGLDKVNVETRATSVCETITKENPDVVFLQEVTATIYSVLDDMLDNCYSLFLGTPTGIFRENGYSFTVMLLRKATCSYASHTVVPFFSSAMSRTLLKIEAKVKGVDCILLTSHFENQAEYRQERVNQLTMAVAEMSKAAKYREVIFGGDLNLRDNELSTVSEAMKDIGVVDIWEETGKRPEAQYTWDMTKNDNLDINYKPRCRFDRLYYRTDNHLKAVYFELVGLERIASCRRFPSDHWGILAHFDKV